MNAEDKKKMLKIVHSVNVDKSQSSDSIFIRLLRTCDSVVVKPLSIIFINCLKTSIWKKVNIVPDKTNPINYL